MKASEANLLKFLKKSPQFVIPIYQRNYSWTAAQCQQLWNDLLRAGRDAKVNAHFIGSIVYVERALSNVTTQESLLVIDGQQRLTTCSLLITALARHFEQRGLGELLEAFSAKKLFNYYLLNPEEDGERHFKLILSETDKETLLALLKNTPVPAEHSHRIAENYALFQQWIAQHHTELDAICQGLAKLVIVDVSLDRAQDNPQLIFESMNSTGLELSQADLIRNYILMGLEPGLQTSLYKTYWRPMEKAFGQKAYVEHFDAFMRHYLTTKTGDIPNIGNVYTAFKAFSRDFSGDVAALVADIHAFARYYCAMALGTETDTQLKQAFHDLRELKVDVAYPFLLDVYHDYKTGRLSPDEVHRIVRLVESYVFRRAVCAVPTNSLNKTFAGMSRSLKKDRYLESVLAAFLILPSYRRFPLDEEFLRHIKTRDLYNFRSRSYWLRKLENHGRKERVAVENYTVEHIMPQNKQLSANWQTELGENWQTIQETWLHTLGNLTLTAYNSEYSDHAFSYKRDVVQDSHGHIIGFAASPLKLNAGLAQTAQWNEAAIAQRANRLAKEAARVWEAPSLDADILAQYHTARQEDNPDTGKYAVTDHPHLVSGQMREVFAALRKQIVALDPCVREAFWKLYVAYKAETNFVDIVPQAKRLLLVLNISTEDLDDPKGLCRDISNIGRWGNGDVEIGVSTLDELPYAMGLIRQAFERQMGELQDA